MYYLLLFHCNNGCRNVLQCYVIPTLPVLLDFMKFQKFKNIKYRRCYRWTITGLREWTGGIFVEPCVLLQTASAVETVEAVVEMLTIC